MNQKTLTQNHHKTTNSTINNNDSVTMVDFVTENECNYVAKQCYGCNLEPGYKTYKRWFVSMFGCIPAIITMLWNEMVDQALLENACKTENLDVDISNG
jgi:hypothetical protein